MTEDESRSGLENFLIFFFRVAIGWTFLWAGIHHFGDDKFDSRIPQPDKNIPRHLCASRRARHRRPAHLPG